MTLYEVFISTLRLNQTVCLVVISGGCVYPLAFLHYCHRGNSAFQHADKSVRAIFDWSEHIKLTHVSCAIALLLFVCLCLLDYYTIRFYFIALE